MPASAPHLRPLPSPPVQLEALFREHHDLIFRSAYRITGSAADAEDVLQTVFLRLARRSGDLDLSPSPAAYLHRAAVNASLDLVRGRGRSRSVALDDLGHELAEAPALGPEARRAGGELREVVRRAIGCLGERSGEMFVLRYVEGYSNREIAEMFGTTQMVVGVVLHRARARVRNEIGKHIEDFQ